MYKAGYYNNAERHQMISFAKEQTFALVTGAGTQFPVATQLPLDLTEINSEIILSGHLMRKTDHHIAFEKNPNVLVLFTSPHAYVDANWYADPMSGSTVNYMSVHARGKIIFSDEAGTEAAVKSITDRFIGKGTPASFENLSKEYISSMVKAITGFQIKVESIEAVFKLSQNRSQEDQLTIISELNKRALPGDLYIARKMTDLLTK